MLKPVYDFVKASKAAGKDTSEWAYTDWANNSLDL